MWHSIEDYTAGSISASLPLSLMSGSFLPYMGFYLLLVSFHLPKYGVNWWCCLASMSMCELACLPGCIRGLTSDQDQDTLIPYNIIQNILKKKKERFLTQEISSNLHPRIYFWGYFSVSPASTESTTQFWESLWIRACAEGCKCKRRASWILYSCGVAKA